MSAVVSYETLSKGVDVGCFEIWLDHGRWRGIEILYLHRKTGGTYLKNKCENIRWVTPTQADMFPVNSTYLKTAAPPGQYNSSASQNVQTHNTQQTLSCPE